MFHLYLYVISLVFTVNSGVATAKIEFHILNQMCDIRNQINNWVPMLDILFFISRFLGATLEGKRYKPIFNYFQHVSNLSDFIIYNLRTILLCGRKSCTIIAMKSIPRIVFVTRNNLPYQFVTLDISPPHSLCDA